MDSPKYIVTSLPGSSEAFICLRDAQGTYEQFAQGDFQALVHIAKLLNAGEDALAVGPNDIVTEAVSPEDIKVGDVVLVEMRVGQIVPVGDSGYTHIHAQPVRGQLWMLGDQHAWTWGWSQIGEKKIERIVRD